jgi:ATP-dependent DNA ligase
VSKRADAAYAPDNRGLWVKVKCLHREEFVVVGWTDSNAPDPGALCPLWLAADQAAFCSVTCGRGSTLVPILIVRGFAASGTS